MYSHNLVLNVNVPGNLDKANKPLHCKINKNHYPLCTFLFILNLFTLALGHPSYREPPNPYRLVEAVEARNYVRSPYSLWALSMTKMQSQT